MHWIAGHVILRNNEEMVSKILVSSSLREPRRYFYNSLIVLKGKGTGECAIIFLVDESVEDEDQ